MEPPSPESREIPLESGTSPPGSSPLEPHSSLGPPTIPSVEVPSPKPTSDSPTSSEGNHGAIGKWFRTAMTKRSHKRTTRQMPSEVPPQSRAPPGTKATPQREKPSIMAPGKRQAVRMPFSAGAGRGYLTTLLSGRLEGPLLDHRFVHASSPFMNIIAYVPRRRKQPRNPLRRVNHRGPLHTQKLVPPTPRRMKRKLSLLVRKTTSR